MQRRNKRLNRVGRNASTNRRYRGISTNSEKDSDGNDVHTLTMSTGTSKIGSIFKTMLALLTLGLGTKTAISKIEIDAANTHSGNSTNGSSDTVVKLDEYSAADSYDKGTYIESTTVNDSVSGVVDADSGELVLDDVIADAVITDINGTSVMTDHIVDNIAIENKTILVPIKIHEVVSDSVDTTVVSDESPIEFVQIDQLPNMTLSQTFSPLGDPVSPFSDMPTTISLTIIGIDDPEVVGGELTKISSAPSIGDVISGVVTVSDIDQNDNPTWVANSITDANGTFMLNTNGSYTFTISKDFDYLGAGENTVISYTITTSTGVTNSVDFTISGIDNASITSTHLASGTAPSVGNVFTGNVVITDIDQNDNPTWIANSITDTNGTFVLNTNGNYSFTVIKDFTYLGAGESVVFDYNVTASDGNATTVEFTINGVDNAEVIIGTLSQTLNTPTVGDVVSGNVVVVDADQNDNPTWVANTTTNTNGTFVLNVDGSYTFTISKDFDYLGASESATVSYNVTTSTGSIDTVDFVIDGVDNAEIVSGDISLNITEPNIGDVISGVVTVSDVDQNDNPTWIANSITDANGTFTINTNGTYSFTVIKNFDYLGAGETVILTYDINTDSGPQPPLSMVVEGVDDPAVWVGNDTDSIGEWELGSRMQLGHVEDVDSASTVVLTPEQTGVYGTFTYTQFLWKYEKDTVLNDLAVGESFVENFTISMSDGSTQNIAITINGNDGNDNVLMIGADDMHQMLDGITLSPNFNEVKEITPSSDIFIEIPNSIKGTADVYFSTLDSGDTVDFTGSDYTMVVLGEYASATGATIHLDDDVNVNGAL